MAGSIGTVRALFASDAMRAAYDAALAQRGLPLLGDRRPVYSHRLQLASAAALPALACELGEVTAADVGAGGLRRMEGVATLWLALGQADDARLLARIEEAIDALRAAVEANLTDQFQRLVYAGCAAEGIAWRDGPVPLRLVPVRFAFEWLYTEGGE